MHRKLSHTAYWAIASAKNNRNGVTWCYAMREYDNNMTNKNTPSVSSTTGFVSRSLSGPFDGRG